MANDIQNKLLWNRLGNIKQSDWIRAAVRLQIPVLESNSGTSHYTTLRDPKVPDANDVRGLITILTPNTYKQANHTIFKSILAYCKKNNKTEDDIWRALDLM